MYRRVEVSLPKGRSALESLSRFSPPASVEGGTPLSGSTSPIRSSAASWPPCWGCWAGWPSALGLALGLALPLLEAGCPI